MEHYLADWRAARPDLDLDALEIISRLSHTARLVEAMAEGIARAHGMKLGEALVLLALLRNGGKPMTPGELGRAVWVTSGGMTYRIDKLERPGLLQREQDQADRRLVRIGLTPAGRLTADSIQTQINAMQAKAVQALSARDRKVVTAAMETIRRDVQ